MQQEKIEIVQRLSNEDIQYIFGSIARGVGNHGSFLTSLANTVCAADNHNFLLMKDFLLIMILKYELFKSEYRPE